MWKMQGLVKIVGVFLTLLFVQIQGVGFNVSESVAEGLTPKTPQKAGERPATTTSSGASVHENANRILSVQVQDQSDETVIHIIGNGSFRNYQFRRLGKSQFLLELAGIRTEAPRASIPTNSARVGRIFVEATPSGSVQLVGTLETPLDRHALTESGDSLVLTLYPLKKQSPRVSQKTSSKPSLPPPSSSSPLPPRNLTPEPILTEIRSSDIPAPETSSAPPATPAPQVSQDLQTSPAPPASQAPPTTPVPQASQAPPATPVPQASQAPQIASSQESPAPSSGVSDQQEMIQKEMQSIIIEEETPEESIGKKVYTGKPISLDLQDADLVNVLRLLADVTGANMVIEPGVSGKITLKVEKIPWDQVLDMILAMNNLGMEEVGDVIRIAQKAKLKAELDERNALIKAEQDKIQEKVKAKQEELKAKQEELKTKQEIIETAKDFGEITTAYLTVNYAPPGEIAAKIGEIKSEKGKISVDQRTKLIIYTDYPLRIQTARQLLARLDKATPQVLIEARIVTVNLNASKALGFTWNFNYDNTGSNFFSSDYQVNLPVAGNSFTGFNLGKIAGQTLWDLDLRISALEQTTTARLISSPKVVTLDGIEAKVTQGIDIPYQEESESGGTTTAFKKANLELTVTPSITPDKRVRMKLDVKKDQPGASYNGQTGIDTRNVTTELLVESGNIVVIGGVIEESLDETQNRTPFISKVPVLGHFFKNKTTTRKRNELLIFISPQIIEPTETQLTNYNQ